MFTVSPLESRVSKALGTAAEAPQGRTVTEGNEASERQRCLLPVLGWSGQVRRRRRAYCQQSPMKDRRIPVTHHCGAAPETDSHCCCLPRTHKSPPASETYHGLL